jgi:hypothetical protein
MFGAIFLSEYRPAWRRGWESVWIKSNGMTSDKVDKFIGILDSIFEAAIRRLALLQKLEFSLGRKVATFGARHPTT